MIAPITKISISSSKLSESALTTHLETLDCIGDTVILETIEFRE